MLSTMCMCLCILILWIYKSYVHMRNNQDLFIYICSLSIHHTCFWIYTCVHNNFLGKDTLIHQSIHTCMRADVQYCATPHTCAKQQSVNHNGFHYTSKPECAIPDDNAQQNTKFCSLLIAGTRSAIYVQAYVNIMRIMHCFSNMNCPDSLCHTSSFSLTKERHQQLLQDAWAIAVLKMKLWYDTQVFKDGTLVFRSVINKIIYIYIYLVRHTCADLWEVTRLEWARGEHESHRSVRAWRIACIQSGLVAQRHWLARIIVHLQLSPDDDYWIGLRWTEHGCGRLMPVVFHRYVWILCIRQTERS